MPKYIVCVREVHIQPWEVEAEDAEEAKDKVALLLGGEAIILEDWFEYSHCLDSDLWTVEEVKEETINDYL